MGADRPHAPDQAARRDDRLVDGQPVVTSGLDLEAFPANIPVGRVVVDAQSPNSSEPDIGLRPLADLNNLNYLQVLLWSSQSP